MRSLVVIYVCTMFLSALLLFFVQPLVGKLLLPLLGGAPALWNTCMLFFQVMLLAGYLYAHGLNRLSLNKQLCIHMVMMGAAAIALPLTAPTTAPQDGAAIGWVLWTLFILVGAPFFAISTTAPLLQAWFSRTTHPTAQDPYHLYAASNLGSMTSLLAYPFLVEPLTQLQTQTQMWSLGFVVLYAALALCGMMAVKTKRATHKVETIQGIDVEPLTMRRIGLWIFLSFVPSSVMLGTTSYITTDIASIPMLWLLPLGLYLLTFIIVFANKIKLKHVYLSQIAPALIPAIVLTKSIPELDIPVFLKVALPLIAMFLLTLSYHANLSSTRPHALHLTAFFLFVSVGGVLGGVFNALISPFIFNSLTEYWLILLAGSGVGIWLTKRIKHVECPIGWFGKLVALSLAIMTVWTTYYINTAIAALVALLIASAAIALFFAMRREATQATADTELKAPMSLRKSLALGGALAILIAVCSAALDQLNSNILYQERSFFGTHMVHKQGDIVKLIHGTTVHGTQNQKTPLTPMAYYSKEGPLGKILNAPHVQKQKVSVIGLGAGAIAAYATQGHSFVFYEIDPVVIHIAKTSAFFTYLETCGAQCLVEEGDGRLEFVRKTPLESQDILILDAYSSDAVPVHLATLEALEAYWKRLKPSGIIAFHISNRYFDLSPILAKLAHKTGAVAYHRMHIIDKKTKTSVDSSSWLVMGRNHTLMAERFGLDTQWTKQEPSNKTPLWTDSYSNLLSALK